MKTIKLTLVVAITTIVLTQIECPADPWDDLLARMDARKGNLGHCHAAVNANQEARNTQINYNTYFIARSNDQAYQTAVTEYNDIIAKRTENHEKSLSEKNKILEKLQAEINKNSEELTLEISKVHGEFLAKLAIEKSHAQWETRSAQTILCDNKLFRQYLLINFSEFRDLNAANDIDKILEFAINKAYYFINSISD